MPIYQLSDEHIFPNPMMAGNDGLLAIGGDLTSDRLIEAYRCGIFPWYSEGQPILWWSPNPRMILFPNNFKRNKSLEKVVKNKKFQIHFDKDFKHVIENCASMPRIGQEGETWITSDMKNAYIELHRIGIAHSVEAYLDDSLVGGLYGLSIGGTFFGESMFHKVTDASKVALWCLVDKVLEWGFDMIDVQQETKHLESMGAESLSRKDFLNLLANSVKKETIKGSWSA
ncbi:MAG: leucyl/phenylalanyl-tRNA--protein transferase [Lentimicrobiaceae bacterium]|jgi:leucyl/phenylalanyl-tRNA--protein transferase|nr:leucyl/phenylalanyl-tRNA--protein transferase [Lentimicrobiaceae bacterium]